jgi:hypothetical protein
MEISITAVSEKRRFTKALVRHSQAINRLRDAATEVDTSALQYDVLQIVFLDRDNDYLRAVGCREDRLFQVEIATPDEATAIASETSLLAALAEKLKRALGVANLPVKVREQIVHNIGSVK